MKKIALLVVTLLLSGTCLANPVKAQSLDKIVAFVNDDVITQSQLNHEINVVKQRLKRENTPLPPAKTLSDQVLEHLIDQKIELQTAARAGIEVDDAEVNNAIKRIAKTNHMTTAELRKKVTADGMTYSQYRAYIKDQVAVRHLLDQQVGSRIVVSKQEVDNFLNSEAYEARNVTEYHIEDILLALPEVPSSEDLHKAQAKAKTVLSQAKKGTNFKKLAIANSDGQQALQGGDLGWRHIEEIPTIFARKVKHMKEGDVAGPIRTANGYHVIKLAGLKGVNAHHYVTETHPRHILIKTNAVTSDKEIKRELNNIRKQIIHGAEFEKIAEKYSQDTGSATKGGDLGWVTPGMLVPPFELAMNNLKVDQISKPVKSQFGWHIIQVLGRRKVDNTKDVQQDKIRKMIYTRKYEEKAQSFIKQMRDMSYVKKANQN